MAGEIAIITVSDLDERALTFAWKYLEGNCRDVMAAATAAGFQVETIGQALRIREMPAQRVAVKYVRAFRAEAQKARSAALYEMVRDDISVLPADRLRAAALRDKVADAEIADFRAECGQVQSSIPDGMAAMSVEQKVKWLADMVAARLKNEKTA